MKRAVVYASLMALAVAASGAVRCWELDNRPMHCDEAVHGIKFGQLLEHGDYRYDPHEYHGPTLNYSTLPVAWFASASRLTEVTELHLRLVPALFGSALVAVTALLSLGIGRRAAGLAAALLALSPAMVFYSRYYIQEMLLVFFTAVAMSALWRLVLIPPPNSDAGTASRRSPRLREHAPFWAVIFGAALGLMHATKETCVIPAAAMLPALAGAMWTHGLAVPGSRRVALYLGLALTTAAVVSAICISCFGRHPQAVVDSYLTYVTYIVRAGGEGSEGAHVYPYAHYLRLAFWYQRSDGRVWTELPIAALALVAVAATLRGKGFTVANLFAARFLCIYTVMVWAVYSLIPYKTPWCLLGLMHPLLLLAGVGAAVLLSNRGNWPLRVAGVCVVCIGVGFSACQAWWASFRAFEDPTNPYVYAHTTSEVPQFAELVRELALSQQNNGRFPVQVAAPDDDYWPLPWYLRDLPHVGWYRDMPRGEPAPLIVVHAAQETALNHYLYMEQPPGRRFLYVPLPTPQGGQDWELRPGVPIRAYAQLRVWEAFSR